MKGRAGRAPTMTTELISWLFYLGVLICMNNATRALETIATCMGKMGSMYYPDARFCQQVTSTTKD
jgi:hypothetical protein